MKQQSNTKNACVASLKLLGDFWTLRIIDSLKSGEMRYCELQRSVGNVNPVTLTNRLQKLEKANVIARNEESVNKLSVTYSLTPVGTQALPVLAALECFSDKLNGK